MCFLINVQLFFFIDLKQLMQTFFFTFKVILLIHPDSSDIYFQFLLLIWLIFHSATYLIYLVVFHNPALPRLVLLLSSE